MKSKILAIALVGAGLPTVASATTYDIYTGYNSANFSYGSQTGGVFTPFSANYNSGCFSTAALACKTNGANDGVPSVIVNTSSSPVTFVGTVTLPGSSLMVHPGDGTTDAVLKFIAPVTSTYSFNGSFTQYDNTNSGNGTLSTVSARGQTLATVNSTGGSYNIPAGFAGTVKLAAGDTLNFTVNNKSFYSYDSTGISGAISIVPEPATWAMMILGMGVVGAALRRRKAVATAAFA